MLDRDTMRNSLIEQEVLREVFELINEWRQVNSDPEAKVVERLLPEELRSRFDFSLPQQPGDYSQTLSTIKNYLHYAVKTGSPRYLNQLFGGQNFPAFLGEVITALTNTSMYTYEVAPVATLMELEVVNTMLGYTGWEQGEGAFMTGGSNSNMVAMLLARNEKFANSKHVGISGVKAPRVFVSERSHFSMVKAANTIGIGQDAVIKVPLDENGRMRGTALRKAILESLEHGEQPFFVASTAGTTETGSFDAIDEVAEVAAEFNLWHHVDGSWGGSLIMNSNYKSWFNGLEKADSFVWNPHKLMNIPLVCSVLLVHGREKMAEHIRSYDADYIYHENDTSAYDLGPASLQCGRRVDVLKLWLAWQFFGSEGYAARMEHLMNLASYTTRQIAADGELELMFPTQSLNINFRYRFESDKDRLNEHLRYELIRKGLAMVNYCRLDSGLSLRLVLLNPDLTTADVDRFLNDVKAVGREVNTAHRSSVETAS